VSPLLAVADALRRRWPQTRLTALGTETGLEAWLVPEHGYELRFVPRVPMPRRVEPALLRLPAALLGAVRAAERAIVEREVDVVVGFGGYASAPAYLAGRRLRRPLVLHEQNARAGLANRLGARLTRYVATTFAGTALPHARLVGMPLRREIATLDRATHRPEGLAHFGLEAGRVTLLVTGGSLGAQRLNDAFAASSRALSEAGVQVLHVSGWGKDFTPAVAPSGARYVVVPYTERMELAYSVADLVVCRAGASTVCELTAVGLPAVYVPLPIGNGEQRFNAAEVIAAGGGRLLDDAAVTPDWVQRTLLALLGDRAQLAAMAAVAATVGQRHADERMVELIGEAASHRSRVTRGGPG